MTGFLHSPVLDGGDPYQVQRSLRLRASANAYMNRTTPASGGDRDKSWVFMFFKRAKLGALQFLHGADTSSADAVYFDANNKLGVDIAGTTRLISTRTFGDPSAHGAFLSVVDAANVTPALRLRIYDIDNGFVEITAWDTDTRSGITAGTAKTMHNSIVHFIGKNPTGPSGWADGYVSEHRMGTWSGTAPTPSSFGYVDSATSQWVPSGGHPAYGTSGSYADFSDPTSATTLCYDRSGNGNHWTPNNISTTAGSTYDSMLDVPLGGGGAERGNYATLNSASNAADCMLSAGNLNFSYGSATTRQVQMTTQGMLTGRWWAEVGITVQSGVIAVIGITNTPAASDAANYPGFAANGWGYIADGSKYVAGVNSAYGAAFAATDVIGLLFDGDAHTFEAFKQTGGSGAFVSQGVLASGLPAVPYFFAVGDGSGAGTWSGWINCGQRPFNNTSLPTGAKAPHTGNLTSTTVVTSGSFTGNVSADGPPIWCNGTPETLTINGNAVTWGTHADKTATGFKLRTSSASYNSSGSNTWTATYLSPSTKSAFKYQFAKGNP